MQYPLFEPDVGERWSPPSLSDLPSWKDARRIGIDTETFAPKLKQLGVGNRRGGFIAGVSFAIEDGPRYYLPIRHQGGDNLPEKQVLDYLRAEMKGFQGELVGAHLAYDIDHLWDEGIETSHLRHRDIQIADPIINELHRSYSLNNIAQRHGLPGKDTLALERAAKDYGLNPKADLWQLPARFVGAYAEQDAVLPLQVLRKQERVIDDAELWDIYNLESAVLPVLVRMRRRGVLVSEERLEAIEQWSLQQETEALERVRAGSGVRVAVGDVWKAGALAPALEALGVELPKTTTGAPSIDKELLGGIDHPVADAIAWARKVNKLRTTFAASIRTYAVNSRIHTTFRQITAETESGDQRGARFGRLSSEHPNMQQQPARDEFAARWRSIYLAEPNKQWAACDYCFSEDTEVLTQRGFVFFKDLLADDLVAQYDVESKVIDYATPIERQRVHYSGDMVHVFGARSTDLLMTPNHRCLLLSQHKLQPIWAPASSYADLAHQCRQITAGTYLGGEELPHQDIITSVAAQADGSLRDRSYRIWVSKPRKVRRCQELVRWSNTYPCEKKGKQTAFVIPIENTPLISGPRKLFDRTRILGLSLACRQLFLKELLFWDGSGSLGMSARYCTTEKHNAEVVQEVAVLSGIRARSYEWEPGGGRKTCYTVILSNRTAVHTGKYRISKEPYDGYVYCVTMPQSTVVVRRNGRVSITGQSQQEPRWTTHIAALMNLPGAADAAQAYHDNPDLDNHQFMADLTGLPRKHAKNVYLGLCYGEGGAKLCRDLGLPTRWALASGRGRDRSVDYFEDQAAALQARQQLGDGYVFETAGEEGQHVLDTFDRRAPFIRELAKKAQKKAERLGSIRTVSGRRLNFPQRPDGSYEWAHKALNRIIQGNSADQVKKALVAVDRAGHFLQLQIHDELGLSVENREEAKQVAAIMRDVIPTKVPFKVDIEIGPSWGEAA